MSFKEKNQIEILQESFKRSQKVIWGLFFVIVALLFTLSGSSLNIFVVEENGGKMPVKGTYEWVSERHFSYLDSKSVNYPLFTDIIPIKNYSYSIGDLMMFSGIFLIVISGINLVFRSYKLDTFKKKHLKLLKGCVDGN